MSVLGVSSYQPADIQRVPPIQADRLANQGLTAEQLQQIAPHLSTEQAQAYAEALTQAMVEADITTPERQAMFLAQLAQETDGFRTLEEYADGSAYEGRADLGNTEPGDGTRFKGRGFIQLTGRHNYEAAGRALGVDLVNNPELAADPAIAGRVAAWYWSERNINEAADQGDFVEVTRRINGGTNGLEDRYTYLERAREAVGDGVALPEQSAPAPGAETGDTRDAPPVDFRDLARQIFDSFSAILPFR